MLLYYVYWWCWYDKLYVIQFLCIREFNLIITSFLFYVCASVVLLILNPIRHSFHNDTGINIIYTCITTSHDNIMQIMTIILWLWHCIPADSARYIIRISTEWCCYQSLYLLTVVKFNSDCDCEATEVLDSALVGRLQLMLRFNGHFNLWSIARAVLFADFVCSKSSRWSFPFCCAVWNGSSSF